MIYWFTGQPAHGKTTLAKMLYQDLVDKYGVENVFHIDGDDIRALYNNADYSIHGRVQNVNTAQKIAHYLHTHGKYVIVSIVSPYIDQREDFKKLIGTGIIEFYVHCQTSREREQNKSIAYVGPKENYCDINTTIETEQESFERIKHYL